MPINLDIIIPITFFDVDEVAEEEPWGCVSCIFYTTDANEFKNHLVEAHGWISRKSAGGERQIGRNNSDNSN